MGSPGERFNKALLPLEGKGIISHIIENIRVDEIVIAVGYKSSQIKKYCSIFHPDKKIKFVDVDNFNGPGSGPGYSMLCCKEFTQCPFYIITADSLLTDKLPDIDCNWLGVADVDGLDHYATCRINDDSELIDFKNKNTDNFELAFTGVVAVKDYTLFWEKFDRYLLERQDREVEFVGAFYKPFFSTIMVRKIGWKDVGRKCLYTELYEKYQGLDDYDLKKVDHYELTFLYKNKVAKLSDPKIIQLKKKRREILCSITPELIDREIDEFLVHDFVNGKNLYQIGNAEVYLDFLEWANHNLFNKLCPLTQGFQSLCYKFYKEKTYDRLKSFFIRFPEMENDLVVASIPCKNVYYYLEKVDWKIIGDRAIPYIFHGDLNFGNIVMESDKNFKLIDWRSDFAGSLIGDLYYDFAKLYAGCIINFYKCCIDSRYFRKIQENNYDINWLSTAEEQIFLHHYVERLKTNGYSVEHVKLIANLIFLNMSPLHLENFSKYLYLQAVRNLELFFQKNI